MGMSYGYAAYGGGYHNVEISPRRGYITTYCADCGKKIKRVVVEEEK